MQKTIFVGNLRFSATEDQVRDLFAEYGTVKRVHLVSDRETGKPRGFGFVEMDGDAADAAIARLNNFTYDGRPLRVNEAEPKPQRPREGGGQGRGGFGGGRGQGGGFRREG